MSFHAQAYSKETAKEALSWLQNQDTDLKDQIKDIGMAVTLYLNSKKKYRKPEAFKDELSQFSKTTPPTQNTPLNLDEKSKETLKEAGDYLNMQNSDEVLKALLQLGLSALKKLI